jgi:hypothetical protein
MPAESLFFALSHDCGAGGGPVRRQWRVNEKTAAHQIWDLADKDGRMCATACVVVQVFWAQRRSLSRMSEHDALARRIDDNLPYSRLYFFPMLWAVNIQ